METILLTEGLETILFLVVSVMTLYLEARATTL